MATKAKEVPDDGVNSHSFTPLLRDQLIPHRPETVTYSTIYAQVGPNINAPTKPEE